LVADAFATALVHRHCPNHPLPAAWHGTSPSSVPRGTHGAVTPTRWPLPPEHQQPRRRRRDCPFRRPRLQRFGSWLALPRAALLAISATVGLGWVETRLCDFAGARGCGHSRGPICPAAVTKHRSIGVGIVAASIHERRPCRPRGRDGARDITIPRSRARCHSPGGPQPLRLLARSAARRLTPGARRAPRRASRHCRV
jgi:hypothetical protein